MDEQPKPQKTDQCPYLQEIFDDIAARSEWNDTDDTILKYRGGKRGKKNSPYKGAPNPVVNILDDITSEKTDIEISMLMNAPRLANFIPMSEDCPADLAGKAAQGFDTFLRFYLRYRQKKEVLTDTKNLRGFSVSKVLREEHEELGVIPTFEPCDPKDVIVPVDTKVPVSRKGERIAFILRYSKREMIGKKKAGWRGTEEIIRQLASKASGDSYSSDSEHDEQNTLEVKQQLLGINASDYAHNKIVVYEIFHYATKWDVLHDRTGHVKEGDPCVTYVCPDVPNIALNVKPWKKREIVQLSREEAMNEIINARAENREPKLTKITYGKKRPWPGIQHRAENKSLDWYDTWGIGRKCMDAHIIATRLKKKKLIFADYTTNPMFEDDGTGDNEQNIMPAPGKCLPKGKKFAQLPVQPSQIDFDIDAERREAAARSGAGGGMYSSEVSTRRKLEKTATQQRSEDAKNSMMSSASVDRFNDPDFDMFAMLWEELSELKTKLPIIHNEQFSGFVPEDVYNYKWMILPATSQKHLNPDLQFVRDMEAFNFAAPYMQQTPMRIYEALDYVLTRHDPFFADLLLQDPNSTGPGNQPPIYKLLMDLTQQIKQLGLVGQERDKEIEAALKMTEENNDEILKLRGNNVQNIQQ